MSDQLPAPLTPADCDLRGLAWMPLNINALKGSKTWMRCKRDPSLAFYLINLWCAAWHELPAASLDDEDDFLCDVAQCSPRIWPKVRDVLLSSWIRCSDGRIYHPYVATEALKSWELKQSHRARTEAATAARRAKFENVTNNVTSHVTSLSRSPNTDSTDKTDNLSLGDGESIPNPKAAGTSGGRGLNDVEFEAFWKSYPRKTGKGAARKAFISARRRASAAIITAGLARAKWPADAQFIPYPATWLHRDGWLDEVEAPKSPGDMKPWERGNCF